MFVDKALEIAELLLPAFETPTGIPYAMFNAQTGTARNWAWASGGCSILSEFGSLHLEFEYLSRITNRTIFYDKVYFIIGFSVFFFAIPYLLSSLCDIVVIGGANSLRHIFVSDVFPLRFVYRICCLFPVLNSV